MQQRNRRSLDGELPKDRGEREATMAGHMHASMMPSRRRVRSYDYAICQWQ